MLDAVRLTPILTISVGMQPHGIAIDEARNRVLIAWRAAHDVAILSGATGAVSAATGLVYVTNSGEASVSVVDPTGDATASYRVHLPNVSRGKTMAWQRPELPPAQGLSGASRPSEFRIRSTKSATIQER